MRTPPRERKLALFERGNDRCPICLTPFTKQDVEEGRATMEHVPAKVLGVGDPIEMCLTCEPCNSAAGRVEEAAAGARREQKLQITIDGLDDSEGAPLPHTGYATVSGANSMLLRMGHLRVPQSEFSDALRNKTINFKFQTPKPHYASIPWLKAAYLTVFSLLGVHGYRYASGKAIESVREQIMKPGEQIIPQFAVKPSAWSDGGTVILSKEPPCWAVKVGDRIVLLPRSWDDSFYERIGGAPGTTLRGGRCHPVKFGRAEMGAFPIREGYDPRELYDGLFGAAGEARQDGMKASFVVVDCDDQQMTVAVTSVEALPDQRGDNS